MRRFRQQPAGRFNRQNAYRAELRSGDESCSGWSAGRFTPTDRRIPTLMGYISVTREAAGGAGDPTFLRRDSGGDRLRAALAGLIRSENYYFWYFLIAPFYLAYTIFVTPWVALGYELTPDYHEHPTDGGSEFHGSVRLFADALATGSDPE